MSGFVDNALLALGPGAMLGLLALGLVLIFRSTGVLNLAHGAQAALGGYIYWDLAVNHQVPPALAFLASILFGGVVGALIYVLVLRPLRGASRLALLIGSIGVLIVIQSILLLVYGSTGRRVPSLLPTQQVSLWGDGQIGLDRILLVVIGVVLTAALWALYRFTNFGLRTTAIAENPVAASVLGHNPAWIAVGNWFLGGALAGMTGALLAPIAGLDLVTMSSLIVPALGAALVGGLISFPLTLVGGFIIQIAQAEATAYLAFRGAGAVSTFLIIVILMVVRGSAVPDRGFVGARMPSLGSGRVNWRWTAFWTAALMILVWGVRPYEWTDALGTSLLVAIVLLSVVVVSGYAGQLSLAQFAFAGVGAVIAAEVASRWSVPLPLLLLLAILGAIPIGALLAVASIRMRGESLAVVTLAFNVLLYATIFSRSEVVVVPPASIFGIDLTSFVYPERYLTLVFIVFLAAALCVASLRRSSTGRRFVAVRGNERAAASIGIRVGTTKVAAFCISAAIAACAGVLLAFRSTAVVYTNFASMVSIDQLGWTVIGGLGFITGPLLGMGFTEGGLGTQIADAIYSDQFTLLPLIGGILLIVTIILNPDGIASVFAHQYAHLRSKLPVLRRGRGEPAQPSKPAERPADSVKRPGRTLHIEGIEMSFGGVHVLKNFSMSLEPGTVHGLIGPNGAGKSTLLDVISGFVTPQKGTLRLGERSLNGLPAWKRAKLGVGRSFQSLELFSDLSVYDNLVAASEINKRRNMLRDLTWARQGTLNPAGWQAVELLGMKEELTTSIDSLSYGKRRLVAIARALATDSDVILLDEPAAGLDEVERSELAAVVRAMATEYGKAVLFIDHDVNLVMEVSDTVTALNFGQVIASGAPDVVRRDPAVIASYIGDEVGAADAPLPKTEPEQDPQDMKQGV